jgi:predicted Zn-dependent protease
VAAARLEGIAEEVLLAAAELGPGAEAQVQVQSGRSANTRFARSEVTSAGDVEETSVEVALSFGARHASTSTNQVDPASLREAVGRAARLARISPEDPEWVPVLGPQVYAETPSAWDAATEALPAESRARAAAEAIRAGDGRKLVVAGFYEHWAQATALATSAGLRARHAATGAELTITARTPDGTGSGWAGARSHRAAELDPPGLARVAADKALRSARPRRLEPGRYTVVLEPAAVGDLLEFYLRAADARAADEGRSFFSRPGGGTRLGEKLFGDAIALFSDPADPELPVAPFDPEGLPRQPIRWIDRGVVAALRTSRFWARKQGRAPTAAPGAYHLLGGQAASVDELVAGVERGVLITRFWYTRWLDPQAILITGLTRDGVFLIEKGELVAPVNNFRFNESPVAMLRNADGLTRGTVPVPGGGMRVPALRTHEFLLASISEAV